MYFSMVLTTCSACAGVILISDPVASNTLLIDSSTADLLGTFHLLLFRSSFYGIFCWKFDIYITADKYIIVISRFSVSGFRISVTLTTVLDT